MGLYLPSFLDMSTCRSGPGSLCLRLSAEGQLACCEIRLHLLHAASPRQVRLAAPNDPLGDDDVDHPPRSHQYRSRRLARLTDENEPWKVSQYLRSRSHSDGVGSRHPLAVRLEVAPTHCIETKYDRHEHSGAE